MIAKQFVILDHTIHSKIYPINSEVPQGSTLGPLLFLLYINDLINCSSVTPRLFADDACLIFNDDAPDKLIKSINDELNRVSDWMAANKLCINTQKSSALLIPLKSNAQVNYQFIFFDGALINTDKSAKYLGIQIDSDLTFKSHIQNLHTKLSRTLGIMFKVKRFFPKNILLQLYYTMFNSHLLYCITVWTSTPTRPTSTQFVCFKIKRLDK